MGKGMQKLIFVVDDNDANLAMAASVLEWGYQILTIPSAEKMFMLLGKKQPDLILLDNEMPEMSGLEALVKLKENPQWKEIPVVFLTGWRDDKLLSDVIKAGALEIIDKPIVPSILIDCVKNHIGI